MSSSGDHASFYDIPGFRAREEALERVEVNAEPAWKDVAYRAVMWLASMSSSFTTDSVWAAIEAHHPDVVTHEPRAMGAVMRRACDAGVIVRTDRTKNSIRPQSHRRPVRVWTVPDAD